MHLLVDFGGTGTKFDRGSGIERHGSFADEGGAFGYTEDLLIQFLRDRIPEDCGTIVVALAATKIGARVSETSTKFTYLSHASLSSLEKKWSDAFACPVLIRHDAEMAAVGELRCGNVRADEVAFVSYLGTSISGALLVAGRPVTGPYTSRVSHIPLDPSGAWCVGEKHRGCFKTLGSSRALKKLASDMGLPANLKEVSELLRSDDPRASEARNFFGRAAESLARGFASVACAVPLHAFVLGGGIVAGAGDFLLDPLRAALRRGDLLAEEIANCIEVRPSKCENGVLEGCRHLAESHLDPN